MAQFEYLASPYFHESNDIMDARFEAVALMAGTLIKNGRFIYSPICHCHPIAVRLGLPRDSEYWRVYNEHMIKTCPKFLVMPLPGWRQSFGVFTERLFAEQLDIPIEIIDPVTYPPEMIHWLIKLSQYEDKLEEVG